MQQTEEASKPVVQTRHLNLNAKEVAHQASLNTIVGINACPDLVVMACSWRCTRRSRTVGKDDHLVKLLSLIVFVPS